MEAGHYDVFDNFVPFTMLASRIARSWRLERFDLAHKPAAGRGFAIFRKALIVFWLG